MSLLFRKCSFTSWYFTISAGHFLKKWEPSLPQFFNSYPPPRLLAMFMYACALSLDHSKANCLNQKKFEDLKKLWFCKDKKTQMFLKDLTLFTTFQRPIKESVNRLS